MGKDMAPAAVGLGVLAASLFEGLKGVFSYAGRLDAEKAAAAKPFSSDYDALASIMRTTLSRLGAITDTNNKRWWEKVLSHLEIKYVQTDFFKHDTIKQWLGQKQTQQDFISVATSRLSTRQDDEAARERLRQSFPPAEDVRSREVCVEAVVAALYAGCLAEMNTGQEVLLGALQTHYRRLEEYLEEILEHVRGAQPVLSLGNEELARGELYTRLIYKSKYIPYRDREENQGMLDEFMTREDRFLWQAMHGPGGTGKSRLALWLCERYSARGWRAGFLDKETGFDFEQWKPNMPTLLVADYALSWQEGKLRKIARDIEQNHHKTTLPIRLLILDRDIPERKDLEKLTFHTPQHWFRDFMGIDSSSASIQQRMFQDPVKLSPLKDDDLWQIMQAFMKPQTPREAVTPEDKEKHLKKLEEFDPQKRPLYAAIYAIIVKDPKQPGALDQEKQSLIEKYINREFMDFWQAKGIGVEDTRLLALATVTNGLNNKKLHGKQLPDNMTTLRDLANAEAKFCALGGRPGSRELPPLEPDLVGELFVLGFFERFELDDNPESNPFLNAAWAVDPEAAGTFLIRCVQDYPDHEALLPMLSPPLQTLKHIEMWANMAAVSMYFFGPKYINTSQDLFNRLSNLPQGILNREGVAQQVARAATNLIARMGPEDMDDAQKIYNDLKEITQNTIDRENVAQQLAGAAFNLLNKHLKAQNIDQAEDLYNSELKPLAEKFPQSESVAQQVAKAATNLIARMGPERIKDAEDIYKKLLDITENTVDRESVAEPVARAAANLIGRMGPERIKGAEGIYKKLLTITKNTIDRESVAEPVARAAFNLLNKHLEVQNIDQAEELYNSEIKSLAGIFPQSESVAEPVARAAANLIFHMGPGRIKDAESIYKNLLEITENTVDRESVAQEVGRAGYNLFLDALVSGKDAILKQTSEDMHKLARAVPVFSVIKCLASADLLAGIAHACDENAELFSQILPLINRVTVLESKAEYLQGFENLEAEKRDQGETRVADAVKEWLEIWEKLLPVS